jgi:putative MATE family efflux protein
MTKIGDLFSLFRRAILGEQSNITHGSIDKAIILLAVPMILELAMESLFAVVDIFFVSRIGVNAVAVVGITESMLTIVYSLGWGLAMGATAVIARRTGEKNSEAANVAAVQAIYLGITVSVLISIIGLFFSADLLALMGASEDVITEGKGFTKWMLVGNIVIMMLFLINGIFRGAGDAALAMRSLWIANGINIALDPLFIFGIGNFEGYGVEGAAIATTIGRGCGVVYQVYHLFKGRGVIKIHAGNWKIRFGIIKNLVNVSAGGTGQFIIASSSWIFLMRIISTFGSVALAGYTIAIRIIIFTILPAWGMSNAAATMVGQNLGAQQPDRAEKAVWRTGFFNMIFMATVMLVFMFVSKPIVSFFTSDPEVIRNAVSCLKIISVGYIFFSYGMIIAQSFNGAGDTRTPTLLNVFGFWIIQIPLAYLLAKSLSLGPAGVFWAIVISETALTIAALIVFRRGKWKKVQV